MNTSPGFSFGQQASTSKPGNSSTFSFGSSAGSVQPGTGFSFGSSSQPGATATVNPLTSTGFSFGSTNPTLQTSTSGFNFGQTNVAPSSGGLSFGQAVPTTTSSLSGFNFGQTTPSAPSFSGFSFGQTPAPTTTSSGISFGLGAPSAAQTTTGFGFGLSTSLATGNSSGGLFGQTVPTVNPASSAATTSLFGQTSTATPSAPPANLFGQSTSSSTPGLLGQSGGGLFSQASSQQTQPSSGINFGLSATTTPGGLFNQASNPLTGTSTSLNFATPASPGSGFSLFQPSGTTTSSGFAAPSFPISGSSAPSGSIFSSLPTSSTPSLGLGGIVPASSTLTAGGLGGFQSLPTDSGFGSIGNSLSKDGGKSAKEAPLPQDIFATVGIFELYKDNEKKCSEDNIRQTVTPFHKLVEDTKKLRQHIIKLSNQHNKLHSGAQKLKSAVIQEAENVEMARRTQDTPMNLQGDNKAPEQFFLRLIRSFEERMTFCRNRIEEVEKCARSNGSVSEITSEDMKEVLKKEHEMVKMLAAKLYTLHNQLISYTNHSSNPDMQPEALFKPAPNEPKQLGISSKNSSILRPALGEGGSGLLNFQNGQQRAKAVSLGAAPPTLPLMQTSISNLLGSNQSNLFTGSSNTALGSSFLNFNTSNTLNNNQSAFGGFVAKPAFGMSPSNTGSIFGNSPINQNQSSGLFGSPGNTNGTSVFGNPKSFKKSHESDETHRKRRM